VIVTSPDGITWTPRASGLTSAFLSVASTPGRVVVVGLAGTIASAPNPSTPLAGMAAWCHARDLAAGVDSPPGGTCGPEDLLAYGLGLPFSPGEGSVLELKPHPLSDGRRGLAFGVPVVDRPDLRYLVEESVTMEAGNWVTIACKEPAQPWTGPATVATSFFADYWLQVEVAAGSDPPLERCFYRLKVELVAR
jgi:hypothetical protein